VLCDASSVSANPATAAMSAASTKATLPSPVAVTISPLRTPCATAWSPVKFCMNHDGRSTAHSGMAARTRPCTAPSPGMPSGTADELSWTTRRTPWRRASSRNGSTSGTGSDTPTGATR
jgi:hypothetical protein